MLVKWLELRSSYWQIANHYSFAEWKATSSGHSDFSGGQSLPFGPLLNITVHAPEMAS